MSRASVPAVLVLLVALASAGCSHPAAWIAEPHLHAAAGVLGPAEVTGYDTNDDRRIDYLQVHTAEGVKRKLFFDTTHGGAFDLTVDLDREDTRGFRTLFVLLDGISYSLVADLYEEGHFRLFHPPGRVIPGFPTVTDNIYADFFETPRPFGVEALYADRQTRRIAGGYGFYLKGGNERVWPRHMLWRQSYLYDGLIYVLPDWAAGRELDYCMKAAITWLDETDEPYAAFYLVSTDALGHKMGHEHLKEFLKRVDEAIEQLVWRARGRLRVLSIADHALNETGMKRVDLLRGLKSAGFRPRDRIESPDDIIVPAFGLVSHVAVSTLQPAKVAEMAVKVEGVELAIYPDGERFVVLGGGIDTPQALIETRADGALRYDDAQGDPLRLRPIISRMKAAGRIDDNGWAPPKAWLDATWDHIFPDPLLRIAKAFEGNVENPPDVLLSLGPEYYSGEDEFDAFATLCGTHGSLRRCATTTYVLSNFFVPPPYQRGTELRDVLKERLGLPTLLPLQRR